MSARQLAMIGAFAGVLVLVGVGGSEARNGRGLLKGWGRANTSTRTTTTAGGCYTDATGNTVSAPLELVSQIAKGVRGART